MAEEKEQEKARGQGQKWVGYRPSATKKASRSIAIGRSEAVLELHHAWSLQAPSILTLSKGHAVRQATTCLPFNQLEPH